MFHILDFWICHVRIWEPHLFSVTTMSKKSVRKIQCVSVSGPQAAARGIEKLKDRIQFNGNVPQSYFRHLDDMRYYETYVLSSKLQTKSVSNHWTARLWAIFPRPLHLAALSLLPPPPTSARASINTGAHLRDMCFVICSVFEQGNFGGFQVQRLLGSY